MANHSARPAPSPPAGTISSPGLVRHGRLDRRLLLGGLLGGAATLALPAVAARAATATRASNDPMAVMVQRINDYRVSNGRAPLPLDHQLSAVAQSWSEHQRNRGSMGHNGNRMAQYGWAVETDGEIVATASASGETAAQLANRCVDGWIGSSGHRAIMLGDWTDMGLGWAVTSSGRLYATGNFIRTPVPSAGQEALAQSRELIGDGSAGRAVVVRGDLAADALAAAGLVDGNTPLLMTRPDQPLHGWLLDELRRALGGGGTVHLVGGALHGDIDGQIRSIGANPVRLRGSSRYETAAMVAHEVGSLRGTPWRVFLANGDGWADAVAAGAFAARFGTPVVLTGRGSLHDAARSVLDRWPEADRVVVGGDVMVDESVVHAAGAWRLTGTDRADTGGRVMLDAWSTRAEPGSALVVSPGWTNDGWATALATTTFSARHSAPLLFAGDGMPGPVADAVRQAGFGPGAPAALRFVRNVSHAAREEFVAATT